MRIKKYMRFNINIRIRNKEEKVEKNKVKLFYVLIKIDKLQE